MFNYPFFSLIKAYIASKEVAEKLKLKKNAKRGLGRGLSSLLGDRGVAVATGATSPSLDAPDIAQTPDGIVEKPLLGWGAGTFGMLYLLDGGIYGTQHSHNIILQISQS